MGRITKINETYNLSYSSRTDSGDTLKDVTISFENPFDEDIVIDRLNTWLTAIGHSNLAVVRVQKKGKS